MATSKKTGKVPNRAHKAKTTTKRQRLNALQQVPKVTCHHKHNVIPLVVAKLKRANSKNRFVSGSEIRNSLYKNHGIKVTCGTIRALLHYIRINGLVKCLVATSYGYYISKDTLEVQVYLKSLRKRIRQIGALAKAIDRQCHEVIGRQYSVKPITKSTKLPKKSIKKHGKK